MLSRGPGSLIARHIGLFTGGYVGRILIGVADVKVPIHFLVLSATDRPYVCLWILVNVERPVTSRTSKLERGIVETPTPIQSIGLGAGGRADGCLGRFGDVDVPP